MDNKNREILMELLHDMEDFAIMKNLTCPPIYLLGGSGCIIGEYIDRATVDIDMMDMNYSAKAGRLFNLLEPVDFLDQYLTTIALGFEKRAKKLCEFKHIDIFVLSKEDIITSKIGRYSDKDFEDIKLLMMTAEKKLLLNLINEVLSRKDISQRVQQEFGKNAIKFKEDFDV